MPTALLTFRQAADYMAVSESLVLKLARAAEYAAELRTGKRRRDDVPPGYVRYLDAGFPAPKLIGRAIRRIRAAELEKWLKG